MRRQRRGGRDDRGSHRRGDRHGERERSGGEETHDVVYGRWPVREALAAGPVSKVFIARGATGGPVDEIVSLAKQKKVPFHFVDREQIDRMAGRDVVHQGVVAMASPAAFASLEDLMEAAKRSTSRGARLLLLDGITDPHNLGSLLRSAVFFGVAGVVIPKWRAASLTSTVLRASAGAARLIPVCQVANLGTAMEVTKNEGFWIIGADMAGVDVRSADLPRPFALVMGSEGEGLHDLVKKKCDVVVSIPRSSAGGGIESLNVGVAGGILLSALS